MVLIFTLLSTCQLYTSTCNSQQSFTSLLTLCTCNNYEYGITTLKHSNRHNPHMYVCMVAFAPIHVLPLLLVRYKGGLTENHQLAQWLWQTLYSFTNEERVLFLRFVSGRSRLPAHASEIGQRFTISKGSVSQHCHTLPCNIIPDTITLTLAFLFLFPFVISHHLNIISCPPSHLCPLSTHRDQTASLLPRPVFSSFVYQSTPVKNNWQRSCSTQLLTVALLTWTTTC